MTSIAPFLRRSPLTAATALPGRDEPMPVPETHAVLGTPMTPPWPAGAQVMSLAMGCFWGTERIFWKLPGVITTASGYQGGFTPNPTYEEVCTGKTGHAETVQVVYDPAITVPELLLKAFWENHDSTTANRQGNDRGTQYRSAIYYSTEAQREAAEQTAEDFTAALAEQGRGTPSTEIRSLDEAGPFYYAEDYHQQYLHKNPAGYCNHGPIGCTLEVRRRALDELARSE